MNRGINKRIKLLSGIAAALMLTAFVIGCKPNVNNPETFRVTFGVTGQNGSLKAKADGITETNKSPIMVEKGKTVTFMAYPASGYEVDKWTVNGTVIKNTETMYRHKVTAKTDVKVLFKASATVTVTGVTLNTNALTLEEGKTGQLTATVNPENATNKTITWHSDKPEVAEVDQNGKVTAKKTGTAKITVTTEDGSKTAECTVTVTAKAPSSVPTPKHTVTFGVEGTPANGTLEATVDGKIITSGSGVQMEPPQSVALLKDILS